MFFHTVKWNQIHDPKRLVPLKLIVGDAIYRQSGQFVEAVKDPRSKHRIFALKLVDIYPIPHLDQKSIRWPEFCRFSSSAVKNGGF